MANSYDVVPVRQATVFEHVRPTVVVRRRTVVIDAPVLTSPAPVASESVSIAENEETPPSSVFLHPGYNIIEDDPPSSIFFGPDSEAEDDEPLSEVAPPVPVEPVAEAKPARPQLDVPTRATIGDVAKRLGVPAAHAVAELVARGLFSSSAKTTVSAEILHALGEAYDRDLVARPDEAALQPARPKRAPKKSARAKKKSPRRR